MDMEGTGARILVESLRRVGITTIFGVPGDTSVALYDALYDAPTSAISWRATSVRRR